MRTSGDGSGPARPTSSSGRGSPLVAPLADVGLVIVDEEHDAAYKSDRTPRLQARDAAIDLASIAGAAVVLGSATPSVESMGHARAGRYRHAVLPARPAGTEPTVSAVDLRAELAAGNRGLLSDPLAAALAALDTEAGERAILVINRRGTASVVVCRDCGHVQACPDCDRPLVYHRAGTSLRCHHCGRAGRRPRAALPARRPGSATSAGARSASSARSASGIRSCASAGWIATSSSARAPPIACWMPSRRAASTSSSAPASSPRASTSPR